MDLEAQEERYLNSERKINFGDKIKVAELIKDDYFSREENGEIFTVHKIVELPDDMTHESSRGKILVISNNCKQHLFDKTDSVFFQPLPF